MTPTHDIPTVRRLLDDAIGACRPLDSETRAAARYWVATLESEGHRDYAKAIRDRLVIADQAGYPEALRELEAAITTGDLSEATREILQARATDFRDAGMGDGAAWILDRIEQCDMIRRRRS